MATSRPGAGAGQSVTAPAARGCARRRSPVTGYVRRDLIVLVPEAALLGDDEFAFAVLEDPDTGDWFGEHPEHPGSALVPLDQSAVIPSTAEAAGTLARVAELAGRTRAQLEQEARIRARERALAAARATARTMPRPAEHDLAIDLWRAALGVVPPAARWWRTARGVLLQTVRDEADSLAWTLEWSSVEELLVGATPAGHEAARRLAGAGREDPVADQLAIDAAVRQAGLDALAALAPDLLPEGVRSPPPAIEG